MSLLLAAGLLLAASPAVAGIVVTPPEIVRVSAHTNPLNIDDSNVPGTIKVRERQPNDSQFSQHISAFLNFDLTFLPNFDPARGDTAEFQLDYEGALNAVNNVPMYVGQITGGAWSSSSLPSYNWATKSGATIGPGSQTREKVIVSDIYSTIPPGSPLGTYSVDVTDIVNAWINLPDQNYGVGVYIGNHFQGAGFDNPQLTINIVPEPATLLVWSLLAALGVAFGWRRRNR
jgi:hypothetical protein